MNNWETAILLWVNGHNTPFLDQCMTWLSSPYIFIPLYLVLVGLLCRKFGWRKALLFTIVIALAIAACDLISFRLLKPLVMRLRPTHDPSVAPLLHVVNNYRGGLYGFPSSHAANTACAALLFGLLYNRRSALMWTLLALWTVLVCYSRIYLGVHYPTDILGGLTLAAGVAALAYWPLRRYSSGDETEAQAACP